MLHLLIKNCNNNNQILRNIKKFSTFQTTIQYGFQQQNGFNNIKNIILRKLQRDSAKSSTKKSSKNLFKIGNCSKLFGGCAISISIIAKSRFVECEAAVNNSRLSGVATQTIDDNNEEKVDFDWNKFWTYLEPHFLKLIAAIFAALAVAYFNIQIPNLLGDLVNTLSKYASNLGKNIESGRNRFLGDIKGPAFRLFGMYLVQSGFTFVYILLLSQIGEQMAAKLRQDLFKQIILQDLEFFDENRTGELVNRLTADVQDFKSCFKQFVSHGLRSGAQLIGGGISLFLISPHMAIIALVSVPAAVSFMTLLGKALRTLSKRAQAQSERATSVCEEALSNIRTVRASACEYGEIELFRLETNKAAELAEQLGYGIAVFQALTNFFLNGMVLTTLFIGGHLMSTDSLSPGQLMAFLVASQGVQRSLAQGSVLLGTMIRGMTAGTRVFEYLAIEPKVDLVQGQIIPQEKLRGEIRFENVSFSYPCRPDQVVLENFSLILYPGQTVALVGASGSGKSTVASLLERFYEPTSGRIILDGYDLEGVSPYWLRSEIIGFIEQQPVLFATTILENIRYGHNDSTIEEVLEVSKLSQSHDFVIRLPNKYETNVGERGTQLSGGQRQRIAIARALLKKPTILILDEATSALDAASEAIVQKALDTAVLNRTTLVIAHRLSTIRNADLIVVLDHGKITEVPVAVMGKHDELMRRKGHYYDLVRQQERKDHQQSETVDNIVNLEKLTDEEILQNSKIRSQG